ncbi:phage tail protein [Fundidesulfovibrio putealis]|uniref:phage tail protein n=1 Tax=Fundidesulfovibrio putealis TaxID=270496 RepID=UPI000414A3CC|nr:phage tail protein [Fundidesulfovibrio putealis]
MLTEDLLPPGIADESGKALAAIVDGIELLDLSVPLVNLVDRAAPDILPHLLDQFHVDFIRPDASEEDRREKVKNSVDWHRRKGTPAHLEALVREMTGLTSRIREKKYFLLGRTGLGQPLAQPPRSGFRLGSSKLGRDGLGMPDRWFEFDINLDSRQARESAVAARDVDALATAVKPARCRHVTRFGPILLGHPQYARLGVDTF